MREAVAWLAAYYPRGLQAEGLTAIDECALKVPERSEM
jgi:hypothetical protein